MEADLRQTQYSVPKDRYARECGHQKNQWQHGKTGQRGRIEKICCEEPACFINGESLKACDLLNIAQS